MTEPTDMIIPLLREMPGEIAALREHMDARFDIVDSAQRSFRHALTADTLMSKLLTGEFEQRIEALERQVGELMAGQT